jgi:dipeptidase E
MCELGWRTSCRRCTTSSGWTERREPGDDSPHGEDFARWQTAGGDSTLGLVGFSIFPPLDHPDLPENTMADAERRAAGIGGPAYAIDGQTAIRVVDGTVDVTSEVHWRQFSS